MCVLEVRNTKSSLQKNNNGTCAQGGVRTDAACCAGDEVLGSYCTYESGQLCCKFTWSSKAQELGKIDERIHTVAVMYFLVVCEMEPWELDASEKRLPE